MRERELTQCLRMLESQKLIKSVQFMQAARRRVGEGGEGKGRGREREFT